MKRICTSVISVILVVIIVASSVSALEEKYKDANNLYYDWMELEENQDNLLFWRDDIIIEELYRYNISTSLDAVEFANSLWARYWLSRMADLDVEIPKEFYDYYYKSFVKAVRAQSFGIPFETDEVRFELPVIYKYYEGDSTVVYTEPKIKEKVSTSASWHPVGIIRDNETGKILGISFGYTYNLGDRIHRSIYKIPSYFDQSKHTFYICLMEGYLHGLEAGRNEEWGGTFYAVTEIDVSSLSEPPVPEPVRGDADGSGALDLLDVTLTLKYLAEWEGITLDKTAADISGNDKVNLSDVSLMLQIIAGWNV